MYVLTGVTGQLGRATLEHLMARVPVEQIAVTARTPKNLGDVAARGVAVRYADYAEPESLVDATKDATKVLLVSTRDPEELRLQRHKDAIDALVKAAVPRVYYTSQIGVDADHESAIPVIRVHKKTERYLMESGLNYTIFRNAYYAEEFLQFVSQSVTKGQTIYPEGGPINLAARREYGAAQALIMAEENRQDREIITLAGDTYTHQDIANIASRIAGREIARVIMPYDEYVAKYITPVKNLPDEYYKEAMAAVIVESQRGSMDYPENTLRQILQREPLPFEAMVADIIARGQFDRSVLNPW